MRNFRTWDIYTDGLHFVIDIYRLTKKLPEDEKFGLTSQIRRAAVSMVNNIAEGSAKSSSKDFHRFLEMSLGSAFEVETILKIIQGLDYGELPTVEQLIESIESLEKRINAFIQKIRTEDL